jgi:hypothetical protein
MQLLPGLFFILLEYLIERLFNRRSVTNHRSTQATRYLVVPSNCKGTILQLFRWKVQQDIGNKSRNIRSGGEGNLLVAVTTNGYFPARDIKVEHPLNLWLDERNSQK